MHKSRLISLLSAVLAASLLCACYSNKVDNRIHMAITGIWTGDQSGAVMTIYGDGRFVIENASGMEDGKLIRGTMERGFDQVLVKYTYPIAVCKDATGVYQFVQEGDKLTFTELHEDCPAREAQFDHSWTLKTRVTENK